MGISQKNKKKRELSWLELDFQRVQNTETEKVSKKRGRPQIDLEEASPQTLKRRMAPVLESLSQFDSELVQKTFEKYFKSVMTVPTLSPTEALALLVMANLSQEGYQEPLNIFPEYKQIQEEKKLCIPELKVTGFSGRTSLQNLVDKTFARFVRLMPQKSIC
eukprot:Pompholyxophrys_punicea_v1_NODE_161_length_3061_cov_8.793413.p1 type:complete len:162 gc:universal NODE_161_length_3061_cov_8.793413:804-1289(+)